MAVSDTLVRTIASKIRNKERALFTQSVDSLLKNKQKEIIRNSDIKTKSFFFFLLFLRRQ